MTLHEELNKSPKNPISNNNNIFIDQTNKEMVLTNFIINFQKENKSIISDLFFGLSETCTQCTKCNISKYNYQNYFFLIFPLEEIRKYKINNLINNFISMNQYMMNINPILYNQNLSIFKMNIQNTNSVSIFDCFNYNEKVEYFTGENAMYCNKCKVQLPASYYTKLYTLPQILIIVLNRGKGIEFKVKLEFPQELNLSQYVIDKNTSFNFELIGVVTHLGESGASGHFIAYCKSPIDQNWYQYNDDLVSKVENFIKQIKDYAMPYILFYQKKENN
jgi:ubiquitin C-terminal hydrolase